MLGRTQTFDSVCRRLQRRGPQWEVYWEKIVKAFWEDLPQAWFKFKNRGGAGSWTEWFMEHVENIYDKFEDKAFDLREAWDDLSFSKPDRV